MNKSPDPASPVIKRIGSSFLNATSSPKKLFNRIFGLTMKISFRNNKMAFGTDYSFVPEQVIAASKANTRKE
jgi:hypothetical protein